MITSVSSVALVGMDAVGVEVEVDITPGLSQFHVVGLPSLAVREAVRRIRAAIANSGAEWPQKRIVANLAPSSLPKEGSHFDLPLAIGVLVASGQIPDTRLGGFLIAGELALDGKIRPIRGALAATMAARSAGKRAIILPKSNAAEGALVAGVDVFGVETLFEVVAFLAGELRLEPQVPVKLEPQAQLVAEVPDMADVKGQSMARRVLEIAAAGRHNVMLVGPPGCGKTMLARRLPGISPPMDHEEALEVTHIWSVAGLLEPDAGPLLVRPFRSPHHHASAAAIIGGGSPWPRPGEVSLAHNGVLFCDEFPLFSRSVIDALREPLEEGTLTIARRGATLRFPARTMLVAAANPCLCGNGGVVGAECTCSPSRLDAYRSRLSGPLLDRIDLHVEVARLTEEEMFAAQPSESSAAVRQRVVDARRFAEDRGGRAQPSLSDLDHETTSFIKDAMRKHPSSARGVDRILRVSRTIADLGCQEDINAEHVAEAFQFRQTLWAT